MCSVVRIEGPTETFIYPRFVIPSSLENDNMVNYTFTTDRGWRVTEYRPFSTSYGVLHTPCLRGYSDADIPTGGYGRTVNEPATAAGDGTDGLLEKMTSQKLRFDGLSVEVLRQLLQERVTIRDKNRSSILGRLCDVTGEISCAESAHTMDGYRARQGLEKLKLDLERQLREEDVTLWRDALELRRELVLAEKQNQGSHLRADIFGPATTHDDNYQGQRHAGVPDKM